MTSDAVKTRVPDSDRNFRHDAFLSYAHEDRATVRRLRHFLRQFRHRDGHILDIFQDETHIRGGDLNVELQDALSHAATLIVCCSRDATDSPWVKHEVEFYLQHHKPARVALVLLRDDPAIAVPQALRKRDIWRHDLRGRMLPTIWSPVARREMRKLAAWLANVPLAQVIDWDRRRLLRNSLLTGLAATTLTGGTWSFAARQRALAPSEVTAKLTLRWLDDEGTGSGKTIDQAMLSSQFLRLTLTPRSRVAHPLRTTWPKNVLSFAALRNGQVKLKGRMTSSQLLSWPSTAGIWFASERHFAFDGDSLQALSDPGEWQGAAAEVVSAAFTLGAQPPVANGIEPAEASKDLTSNALQFYGLGAAELEEWQNCDYSASGVPLEAELELFLRGRQVTHQRALCLRVREHDEDARDLHVLYFSPFLLD